MVYRQMLHRRDLWMLQRVIGNTVALLTKLRLCTQGASLTPGRSRLLSPRVTPRLREMTEPIWAKERNPTDQNGVQAAGMREKTEPTWAKEENPSDQNGVQAANMPRGVQFLLANEEPCCIPPSTRTHQYRCVQIPSRAPPSNIPTPSKLLPSRLLWVCDIMGCIMLTW